MIRVYQPSQNDNYSKNLNLFFVRRYFSLKKLVNLSRGILAQRKRVIKTKYFPYVVYIDPTNVCPLQCPLCPTGLRQHGRATGLMSFSICKKIINQLKDYLFFVRLYNWGEPFLNPELFKMIAYTHSNNIGTVISSNFFFVNDQILQNIAQSPLDYLQVSLDGINQQSYEKYRRGGDFERVVGNLKKLIFFKKKFNNKKLKIEWLFVVNKYNQQDVGRAVKLAQEWGVDIIHFSPIVDSLSVGKMDRRGEAIYNEFRIDYPMASACPSTCSWLYSRMVFNWDGKVSPCCALDDCQTDFGDINQDDIKDLWNNNYYQTARKVFKDKLQNQYPNFICSRCLFMK